MLQIGPDRSRHNRDARIEWWIRVEPVSQIVLQVMMNSKTSSNSPLASTRRVPGQTDAGLQKQLRAVFDKCGRANDRIGLDDPIRIDVIGGVSMRLIKPIH